MNINRYFFSVNGIVTTLKPNNVNLDFIESHKQPSTISININDVILISPVSAEYEDTKNCVITLRDIDKNVLVYGFTRLELTEKLNEIALL